jgi:3-phosphoshikimate 1-carboxyvinyltransferase
VNEREIAPLDGPIDATLVVPGSRSITNRAIVCAALAQGTSTLRGWLNADDTDAMRGCLTALGVPTAVTPNGGLEIHGTAGRWAVGPVELDVRLSGTTSRFVLPLLPLGRGTYRLDGGAPMRRRPMGDGVSALQQLGVTLTSADGHLPIEVTASGLTGGRVEVAADASSQFLSGLLMVGPALDHGLDVSVTTALKSAPYVDMTRSVMDAFGVAVAHTDSGFEVERQKYRAREYAVEPDASSACYFMAAAAAVGGSVTLPSLHLDSIQGDVQFAEVLVSMGCQIDDHPDGLRVSRAGVLHGVDVDMSDISDQVPTLAVLASFADSPTTIEGVGFIRHKESDRIGGLVAQLGRLGVDAQERDDGVVVRPGSAHGGRIDTADDHRIAMSFAVAGLVVPGVIIEDPGCVSKTYPRFFDDLSLLRTS